jgi:hypothetical protein
MDRSALTRWRRRMSARLGLAPAPPGYRPPPGASVPRLLFAFMWLMLGMIQLWIFAGSGSWAMLALAVLWFGLAALHLGRARRVIQAERQAGLRDPNAEAGLRGPNAEPDLDDD